MKRKLKQGLSMLLILSLCICSCIFMDVSTNAASNKNSVSIIYDVLNQAEEGGRVIIWYFPYNSDGTLDLTMTEFSVQLTGLFMEEHGTTGVEKTINNIPGWPCKVYVEVNSALACRSVITLKSIKINGNNVLSADYTIESVFGPSSSANITFQYNSNDGLTSNWNLPAEAKVFPSGYDFNRDRYSFRNISDTVSKEIYLDIFGPEKGEVIYNGVENGRGKHGLCYGMAATTGSLLLNAPNINSFVRYVGPCNYISDINKGTKCFELNTITAKNFIKYGYATQFSTQAETTFGDCSAVYNAVENYMFNGGLPVMISLKEYTYNQHTKKWSQSFGHRVLAVGLTGDNGIIIDDSNANSKQTIYFTKDKYGNFTNEWTYAGYSETTNGTNMFDEKIGVARIIGYNTAIALPYIVLAANAQLDGYPDSAYEDELHEVDLQTSPLDLEYNLVSISSNSYDITSNDGYLNLIEKPETGNTNTDIINDLYWVKANSDISVSNLDSESNEIIIANNEAALKAVVGNDSNVKMSTRNNLEAEITTTIGNEYSITIDTTNKDGKDMDITTTGIASDDKITATQTDTGLLVTGISDGTVTLSVNDEVIASETIENAVGDIEITYDKDSESTDIDAEYHSHSYESTVIKPASCYEKGTTIFACSCGDTYSETIELTDHINSSWIVDKDSTCSTEGSKHIECTVCEEVIKIEVIAKLPHNYSSVATEVTCESGGYITYTCSCGDSYIGDEIPAKGHNFVEGVCTSCGESKIDNCSCNCHKSGFMGFIWKIINFFNKLFKSNKTCACGVSHY